MKSEWKKSLAGQRASVDTNILIYAVSGRETPKHAVAAELLSFLVAQNGFLTLQTLCEFANVGVKKLRLPVPEVEARLQELKQAFEISLPNVRALDRAVQLIARYQFAFWDAMLCAVVSEGGAAVLFSEDMQDRQVIDGLKIVNPFV
ncbi:MAG: PIN domain-containing protein [Pyrinomonadaceae bacterium]